MAAYGWRKDHSVADWLFAESYRFDFFQAVRLLQMLAPDKESVGEGVDPEAEAVRFSAAVDLGFPASDVAAIKNGGEFARMTVNFLGLAGAQGPLPAPYTELLVERDWRHGDPAPREFLDIFNHRLISLFYRARKAHRISFDAKEPGEDAFSTYLFALMGLGTENLRTQLSTPPRALLFYAGLLAQEPRSMTGLKIILGDYFQVPVEVRPFQGQWCRLAEDQLTTIGARGRNHSLGRDLVILGRRVWDQHGRFELRLGPLSMAQFIDFLPIGTAFDSLCELTRFYAGDNLDFTFQLLLRRDQMPLSGAKLSAKDGAILGWTAWLSQFGWASWPAKTKVRAEDNERVTISPTLPQLPIAEAKLSAKDGALLGRTACLSQTAWIKRLSWMPQPTMPKIRSAEHFIIRRKSRSLSQEGA